MCAVMLLLVIPAAVSARPRKPAKPAPVPPGFVGMVIDGPLYPVTEPPLDMATQLDSMVATGVETMRATFDWSSAQPYQNFSQVPNDELSRFTDIGGVPTDFTQLDQFVGLAAQRRMSILPTVLDAPKWDRINDTRSLIDRPRSNGPYASFLKALVQRYGPNGSFWRLNPGVVKVPIRPMADLERAEHPGVLVGAAVRQDVRQPAEGRSLGDQKRRSRGKGGARRLPELLVDRAQADLCGQGRSLAV